MFFNIFLYFLLSKCLVNFLCTLSVRKKIMTTAALLDHPLRGWKFRIKLWNWNYQNVKTAQSLSRAIRYVILYQTNSFIDFHKKYQVCTLFFYRYIIFWEIDVGLRKMKWLPYRMCLPLYTFSLLDICVSTSKVTWWCHGPCVTSVHQISKLWSA